MEEKAAVFFEVCARDSFASGTLGIKSRSPEDDVLAVEGAIALADRHRRLPRVIPHGREAVRLRIETGDSGARAFGTVSIDEREVGLEELAVLDHVLLAGCFRHDRLAVRREKGLHNVPITDELCEQLLTGTHS